VRFKLVQLNFIHRILYTVLVLSFFFSALSGCNGQNQNTVNESYDKTKRVGGDCEAGYCDLLYKGMPEEINSVDTSAGWYEKGQKLVVTGTVFQIDGRTPAAGVIVYYHHTDNNGYYSPGNEKPENQTRHGHIRGWIKTGEDGKYTIYTIRPAPYPGEEFPAHIHWLIKEPDIANEYWVEDLVFEDDKLLIPFQQKHTAGSRGGNGVVRTTVIDNIQFAQHDFILGLNIPNYPQSRK